MELDVPRNYILQPFLVIVGVLQTDHLRAIHGGWRLVLLET